MSASVPLRAVYQNYKAIFFDAFGVLNDNDGIMPGAAAMLQELNAAKFPYMVVTNDSSNQVHEIGAKYRGAIPEAQIVTSGSIVQEYLQQKHRGKKVLFFGEERSAAYLRPASENLTHISRADINTCYDALVILGCGVEDWRRHLDILLNLVHHNPEMDLLAPNPDLVYYAGPDQIAFAAGSLAGLIEKALHRSFTYFGKPHRIIYDTAMQRLNKHYHKTFQPKDILMVGDNFVTDIKGAIEFGLASGLILTGITKEQQVPKLTKQLGLSPTHVLSGF